MTQSKSSPEESDLTCRRVPPLSSLAQTFNKGQANSSAELIEHFFYFDFLRTDKVVRYKIKQAWSAERLSKQKRQKVKRQKSAQE
jgi:hypothetical protein